MVLGRAVLGTVIGAPVHRPHATRCAVWQLWCCAWAAGTTPLYVMPHMPTPTRHPLLPPRPFPPYSAGNRLWEWFSVGRYGTKGYNYHAQTFEGEQWPEELGEQLHPPEYVAE